MNQQLSNIITQALVLVIGAIYTYYQQHKSKVDAQVKDNQAAKATLDVVNRTAQFIVHDLEAGDLDNKQKQASAVNTIKTTLTVLGLPAVPENVISGAVESAVSAMHLAYQTASPDATVAVTDEQIASAVAQATPVEVVNAPTIDPEETGGGPIG